MQELERKLEETLLRNRELELKNTFLRSDNNKLQSNMDKLQSDMDGLQFKLAKLSDELLYLRRTLFGRSSERYIKEDPNQLSLDFYGLIQLEEEKTYLTDASKVHSVVKNNTHTVKKHPVRKPLPEHLQRRREVIDINPLPEGAKCIGEEITEILEYIPGELYVREIVRKKYVLKDGAGIIMGDLPGLPLPRSNAGASLLANILISKFQDHQPFYRQLEIFKRSGIHLAASTVNDWSASAINLLEPLYQQLKKDVLSSDYIQIDESTIPVLDKDKPGATRKGYHWVVRSPEKQQLFFHYDKGSRAQYVVVDLLKDFEGTVQSDGYGAYDIYEKKQNVLLLGCWAHARRKFEQALGNDPPRAEYALEQIRKLYHLEQQATENNLTTEQISILRKEKAYPILRDFEKWIDLNYSQVLPKSKIGQAMSYTYAIYQRLARYVLDGR